MTLAARLKECRTKAGLTQEGLAAVSKTSQQYIDNIESGKVQKPRKLSNIANALGVKEEYLQYGSISSSLALSISDWKNFETITTTKKITISQKNICLIVDDDSMISRNPQPSFPPGTIIIVDPNKKPQIENLVIARHKPTGKILFRKYTDTGIVERLSPLNELRDSCLISEAEILGVVVASMNLDL